jgi:hypothetical protein
VRIYGVDFTCAPRRAKPITVASGLLAKGTLHLEALEALESFEDFEAFLRRPGPWVGGFDLPFALPLELLRALRWPTEWRAAVSHCASLSRLQLRKTFDEYRATRPAGAKYLHRTTDLPAGSSSPMKLVNPPVALMFHEGTPRLLAAGVHVPALAAGDASRVALEAYPGLLVRKQLGLRASYKSDTRSEHTAARLAIRRKILSRLLDGAPLGVRVQAEKNMRTSILGDGSGDRLDAVICAVQAAWAAGQAGYGLPPEAFSGEGWIVSALSTGSSR